MRMGGEVDQQGALSGLRQAVGQGHRRSRLADAAFLIEDRDVHRTIPLPARRRQCALQLWLYDRYWSSAYCTTTVAPGKMFLRAVRLPCANRRHRSALNSPD